MLALGINGNDESLVNLEDMFRNLKDLWILILIILIPIYIIISYISHLINIDDLIDPRCYY